MIVFVGASSEPQELNHGDNGQELLAILRYFRIPQTECVFTRTGPKLSELLQQQKPTHLATVGIGPTKDLLQQDLEIIAGIPQKKQFAWGETVAIAVKHPGNILNAKHDEVSAVYQSFAGVRRALDGIVVADLFPNPKYQEIKDSAQVKALLEGFPGPLGVDTETRPDGSLWCVSLCKTPGEAYVVMASNTEAMREVRLQEIKCVFHNAVYDRPFLQRAGILTPVFEDTMVMGHNLQLPSLKLKVLARTRAGMTMREFKDVAIFGNDIALAPPEEALPYAARDADATLRLFLDLSKELETEGLWKAYEVDRNALPMAEMLNQNGVLIDREHFAGMQKRLGPKHREIEVRLIKASGNPRFNPGAPKQVSELLFNKLKLSAPRATKTGFSTDNDTLTALKDAAFTPAEAKEVIEDMLEYRKLDKLISTYIKPIPTFSRENGRVYANVKVTGTVTTRWTMSDPLNMQGQPVRDKESKEIRDGFVASPGHVLLSVDLSQIELRVLAHISRDPGLVRAFLRGEDIHQATANDVGVDRYLAKVLNFGILYGLSVQGILRQLPSGHDKDEAWAKTFLEQFFSKRPGIRRYVNQSKILARNSGCVRDPFGGRRLMFPIFSPAGNKHGEGDRMSVNTPIQMGAARVMKLIMAALANAISTGELNVLPIIMVHDELIMEVPQEKLQEAGTAILQIIKTATLGTLIVPVQAELKAGPRWGSMKALKITDGVSAASVAATGGSPSA